MDVMNDAQGAGGAAPLTSTAVLQTTPARNGDDQWDDFSGLYSKAILQDNPGIVNKAAYQSFLDSIQRGRQEENKTKPVRPIKIGVTPLFEDPALKLGGDDKLNGPQGAFAGQYLGFKSDLYSTALPPKVGSNEYAVELAELYWASLLRDVPFSAYVDNAPGDTSPQRQLIVAASTDLSQWAQQNLYRGPVDATGNVTPSLLFRGGLPAGRRQAGDPAFFSGETVGPYLSQLCLSPTSLGAQPIDQKIQTFQPGRDFMTDLGSWFAVQNGKQPSDKLSMDSVRRYIRCGRDLAAYTHVDQLYQAYLVAFLVMASWQAPANPGIPYGAYKHQKAFGAMGGPDVIGTLGAVARAAIDAVWWQKWAVDLRHRPEAGGGLVHIWKTGLTPRPKAVDSFDTDPKFGQILAASLAASSERYSRATATLDRDKTFLLSQAFPEGSPTHPAYPTGHGTVAGACITVLKFFFDGDRRIAALTQPVVPSTDGLSLSAYYGADAPQMTVNGELHKLAHNISLGHGVHGGIHWRSDTDESMILGEAVAIRCLHSIVKLYAEPCEIKLTRMDGGVETFTHL